MADADQLSPAPDTPPVEAGSGRIYAAVVASFALWVALLVALQRAFS
jgi:hypothetical protein